MPAAAQHDRPAPQQAKPATGWKPRLLDAHQLETVAVLADLIIPATDTPGAREAKVHEFIDLLLADGPSAPRVRFIQGLGWLDGYSLRVHKQPFVRCTPDQQKEILTTLSLFTPGTGQTLNRAGTPDRAAEPDRPVSPPTRPGGPAAVPADPDLSPGARFFTQVKSLTVDGYYTSPVGIRELNKGGRVPSGFGCKHDHGK